MYATTATRPCTDRQFDFLLDLVGKHTTPWDDPTFSNEDEVVMHVMERLGELREDGNLDARRASALIDDLKARPRRASSPAAVVIEPGVYELAGVLYRAYLGQQSGKVLCKRALEDGGLEYVGQADRHLAGARRLSLEEAKAWGRTTGHCCVCGRRLDDPESVDAGIGPVCASRV